MYIYPIFPVISQISSAEIATGTITLYNITGTPHNFMWATGATPNISFKNDQNIQSTTFPHSPQNTNTVNFLHVLFIAGLLYWIALHCWVHLCNKQTYTLKLIKHFIISYWLTVRATDLKPQHIDTLQAAGQCQQKTAVRPYCWFPRLCKLSHKIVTKKPLLPLLLLILFCVFFLPFLSLFSHLDQDWEKNNKCILSREKGGWIWRAKQPG